MQAGKPALLRQASEPPTACKFAGSKRRPSAGISRENYPELVVAIRASVNRRYDHPASDPGSGFWRTPPPRVPECDEARQDGTPDPVSRSAPVKRRAQWRRPDLPCHRPSNKRKGSWPTEMPVLQSSIQRMTSCACPQILCIPPCNDLADTEVRPPRRRFLMLEGAALSAPCNDPADTEVRPPRKRFLMLEGGACLAAASAKAGSVTAFDLRRTRFIVAAGIDGLRPAEAARCRTRRSAHRRHRRTTRRRHHRHRLPRRRR